ncbi:MAG: hypothetical protein ABIP89_02885, partial [Polyangiaceae bacterium]
VDRVVSEEAPEDIVSAEAVDLVVTLAAPDRVGLVVPVELVVAVGGLEDLEASSKWVPSSIPRSLGLNARPWKLVLISSSSTALETFLAAVKGMSDELGGVKVAGFESYGEIAVAEGDWSGFQLKACP